MTGPSPHLSWSELGCKDGTPYPHEWRGDRAVRLAEAFEQLRALVGQPIVIGSAYRTKAYNARVPGSARNSQHIEGRALDLYPPDGWTPVRLANEARKVPTIRGLAIYATFVHIDVRPGTRLAHWNGPSVRTAPDIGIPAGDA